MEGQGDYSGQEDWDRPTERLWDTPTENLHVESDRDHPANEDGGTDRDRASSGQTAEDASTTISDSEHGARRSRGVPRPRPRKQLPENLFSPPPQS